MPLYDFHCQKCDQTSELLVRGDEKPVCPECGGQHLVRQLSVVAAPAARSKSGGPPPAGSCGSGCACFPAG